MTDRIRSFSGLAALLHRAKQRSDDEDEPRADDEDRDDAVAKKKKKKLKTDEEDQKDEEDKKDDEDKKKEDESAAIAARIVHAGRVRRGEVIETNSPPIVSEAARHAGTATYTTPVKDPAAMAAAIIAAAKKARLRT